MGSRFVVRLVAGICMGVAMLLAFAVLSYAAGAGGAAVYGQYCGGCHGDSGQGTAYGPDIAGEVSGEVRQVTRMGDDEMPAFGPSVISDEDLASLAQYVGGLSGRETGNDPYGEDDDASHGQYGGDDGDHCDDNASGGQYGPDPKPGLSLEARRSDWKNLSAYREGLLTVVYEIENHSGGDANMIKIIGLTSTSSGVELKTGLPLTVGNVAIGDRDTFKLEYRVPAGTHSYRSLLHATAMTDDGNIHHYPVETSHSD